jgi:hypothetical protein
MSFAAMIRPRLLLVILVICLALLLSCCSGSPKNDWVPVAVMRQAVARSLTMAEAMIRTESLGYAEGTCMTGGLLSRQGTARLPDTLARGVRYAFVAAGDDNVTHVTLRLLDSTGTVVARDQETSGAAHLLYQPQETGEYALQVSVRGAGAVAYCSVVLLSENGTCRTLAGSSPSLDAALAGYERIARAYNASTLFLERNSWTLLAAIIHPDETATWRGLKLQSGSHLFLASGDPESDGLDLRVTAADRTALGANRPDDQAPVVSLRTPAGSYGVSITRHAGTRASFVTAIVAGKR